MSRSSDPVMKELGELTALACDGKLSHRQTARLEEILLDSAQARRYYLLYMHLHGELVWQQAAAAEVPGTSEPGKGMRVPTPTVTQPKPDKISRLRLIGFLACAAIAVGLLITAYLAMPDRKPSVEPVSSARTTEVKLSHAVQPRWGTGSPAPATGEAIPLDRRLELEHGVIELTQPSGTRLIVTAPAVFRYVPGGRLQWESGNLTVLAEGDPDVVIAVGDATIELVEGTFGLNVDRRRAELHLLDGRAVLRYPKAVDGNLVETLDELAGGEARAWEPAAPRSAKPIDLKPERFMTAIPERSPKHSAARMRALVGSHAHLIHHYPFEGTSRLEKCQDRRGTLHLTEVVMYDGRGRGLLDYSARGLDLTTEAVRPHRGIEEGNSKGVALQSEVRFRSPKAMTVELLLRYQLPENTNDESVALAVATRNADRDCGFYVAAVGPGHLSLLLDGDADWVETDTLLEPDRWYYVAMTFQAGESDTTVNGYVADLSVSDRKLRHVLKNETVPGLPATSRLGIGKGFDYTGAHGYPWPGDLDEVAVYDAVLDQAELEQHLQALLPDAP